jgi:type I restriction enzyme M protein
MTAIERDNPSLKGVLPREYARPGLDKQRLGQLINLVSDIALGDPAARARDTLGRVFEYFLKEFAGAEGKKGGQGSDRTVCSTPGRRQRTSRAWQRTCCLRPSG